MKAFLKVYFKIILPISIVLAVLPIPVLVILKKFVMRNYLNTIFWEAAACLIFTLFTSRSPLQWGAFPLLQHGESELMHLEMKEREARVSNSTIIGLIGLTLFLILFVIYFLGKLL